MARIVRGALLQATWTSDKQSMIDKHVKYVERAAKEGAQVMCFQ
jgi:N-carbamoylputrescine amidase